MTARKLDGGRLLRKWCASRFSTRRRFTAGKSIYRGLRKTAKKGALLGKFSRTLKIWNDFRAAQRQIYISAYELRAFGKSLELIPNLKKILQKDTIRFGQLLAHLPECRKTSALIESSISEELPSRYSEQVGIIKTGFSEELDKLRETLRDGKSFLKDLEKRERERSGIKSLRVGFNKVFGYYIEITKPNLHLAPTDYQRKQTLVPSERFVTLELKEYESLVIHAQERIAELENSLFRQICLEIGKARQEILLAAATVAYTDAICSLAETADEFNYCRPTVNETSLLRIKNGRHIVIEKILQK